MFDLYNPTENHQELRKLVAQIGQSKLKEKAAEYDDSEELNEELLRAMGSEYQLFGITVPEEGGGSGMDTLASVIVHEELSYFDPAFTLSYLSHEVLFVNNLYHSAQSSLIEKYIPKVLSGEYLAGMCLSEPDSGTDVLGMKTHAKKKGDSYILNGVKQWITNATLGDVFLVYAKMDLNDPRSVSSFVVEKKFAGCSVGKKEKKWA